MMLDVLIKSLTVKMLLILTNKTEVSQKDLHL